MMKNIRYFNVCEGILGNIKKAHVFHHPVEAKSINFNPYINIRLHRASRRSNVNVGQQLSLFIDI